VLFVNIDVSALVELLDIQRALNSVAQGSARDLAMMIKTKATELAAQKLKTRRQLFVDGLKMAKVTEDVWVVSLDAKVRWIDDGQPRHNMLDNLLKSKKAKRAADGSRYLVVPFDHGPGKGPAATTPAQQDLISTIKAEMKERGIPFGKIETDAAGQARLGKLHSFDITKAPIKSIQGPGQGKGPVGSVKQGPTGIPLLQGVTVYQNKDAKGRVKKQIVTYRIASSKHEGQGRWEHPGNNAINIMEDATKWAMQEWEKEIAPALLNKVMIELGGD